MDGRWTVGGRLKKNWNGTVTESGRYGHGSWTGWSRYGHGEWSKTKDLLYLIELISTNNKIYLFVAVLLLAFVNSQKKDGQSS